MSLKKITPLKATYDLREIFAHVADNLEQAGTMLLAADEIEDSMYEAGCSTGGSTTPVRAAGLPQYIRLQAAVLEKVAAKIEAGETTVETERGVKLHELFLTGEEFAAIENDASRIYDVVAEAKSLAREFNTRPVSSFAPATAPASSKGGNAPS